MFLWCALLALGLLVVSPSTEAADVPEKRTLEVAETLIASQIGADRQGNLWAWNHRAGLLRVFTEDGNPSQTVRIPDLRRVDFDAEYGLVGINWAGNELTVRRFREGGQEAVVALPERATDVVWLDGQRVALAPREGTAVHVFNLPEKRIEERWGKAEPVQGSNPDPGFHVQRNSILRWDSKRKRLWALETLAGRLRVFSASGSLLHEETLTHPRLAGIERWLEETDRKMKEEGRRQETMPILWTALALDSAGDAVLVDGCKSEGTASVVTVGLGREAHRQMLEGVECCSIYFTSWKEWLIFHRTPDEPRGCNGIRRWP
jgi:hypothetical protein